MRQNPQIYTIKSNNKGAKMCPTLDITRICVIIVMKFEKVNNDQMFIDQIIYNDIFYHLSNSLSPIL